MQKKTIRFYLGMYVLLCVALIGCTNNESGNLLRNNTKKEIHTYGDRTNLDLSKIKDNIALPPDLYELKTKGNGPWDDNKIYKEFPGVIASFGGPTEEEIEAERDFVYETWISNENYGWKQVFRPFSEWNDEKIWDIYYKSNNICCNMNASRQVNMFRPDIIERITGTDMKDAYFWTPRDFTTIEETFTLSDDEIKEVSYQLDGQDVFLQDAVTYVENFINDKKSANSEFPVDFEYRVKTINVYRYGENYGLEFDVNIYCDKILVDEEGNACDKKVDNKQLIYFGNVERIVMLQKNTLASWIDLSYLPDSFETVQLVENNIDYEKSLDILSGYMSHEHKFKVTDAKLIYVLYTECDQNVEDGDIFMRPVWHFEISTEGMQQYNRLFIDIDIETGDIVERYA